MENTEASPEITNSRPDDVKPKTAMEHWLKRQFTGHSLKGMLEALREMQAGTPVPYLAFYAKDKTDGLKSSELYQLLDAKTEWEEISRRQQHMLQEIQAQGRLSDELKIHIERSTDLDRLEDLYVPFKLKKQTLGVQAKEAGLGTLAEFLWNKSHGVETPELPGATLEELAAGFAKPDSKFPDATAVLKGVQDILVERIAESFELRSLVRSTVFRRSKVKSAKGSKAKPNSKYSKFFDYQEPIGSLKKSNASHRYLAMRKGWMEDELVLSFERPDEGILLEKFEEFACPNKESIGHEVLVQAARLALKGSVYTVMENEAHRHLKEESEKHVIENLSETLRKKLLRSGYGRKAVMGVDPGNVNHPCSLALVDKDGKFLLNIPFRFEEVTDASKSEFLTSLENLKIEAIAVAHAPKSKEVRDGFKKILEEAGKNIPIVTVHEHSANIYSSSPSAKEEFPALDVNARRAVFVARYLQDPLSVVMRIEPKFLSLGEFQHEVSQQKLRTALNRAIELCVNFVGVDPNFAPTHVLAKVAGLNNELANALVQFREATPLTSREDLKKVPGFSAVFAQCAGFLRVMDSANPLDKTFVHPDHYSAVSAYFGGDPFAAAEKIDAFEQDAEQATALGSANLKNIAFELRHPAEDPRGTFQAFEFDSSLKALADLKKDHPYAGVVTNVTSFGAFVDVGIEQDGLVHISELSDALAKNPFDTLFPGDVLTVWVSGVNEEKKQISLTMKDPSARAARGERRPRGAERGDRPARGPRPPRRGNAPKPNAPSNEPPGFVVALRPDGEAPPAPGEYQSRGPRRERGEKREPREGERRDGRPQRKDEKDRKPARKPTRDPKTGAVVNFSEDNEGRSAKGGPRLPTKAKPVTFNPFANLATMLNKDKEKPGE